MTRLAEFVGAHRRVVIVLAIGFLLRLAWLIYAHPDPVSDYWVYRRIAENMLDEGFFGVDEPSALWLPGHPVLLSGLMLISRSVPWLGLVMVLLSTAGCLLVYLVARRLTGREQVALVAAAAYAVHPQFVLYSPVLGTEHLFVLLLLGSILMTLSLGSNTAARAVGAGSLAGLAVLTRGEMVFYVPILWAVIWFGLGIANRMARARIIALSLGATALVVTPWLIRNSEVIEPGVGLTTVSGMNFWFGHRPGGYGFTEEVPWPKGDDVAANRIGWELGLEHIRQDPFSILESARDGTTEYFSWPQYALEFSTQEAIPDRPLDSNRRHVPLENSIGTLLMTAGALWLSLSAAAFLTWPRWGRPLRIVVLGMLATGWFGHAVLLFGHPRFRFSLDVILAILVASTLVDLWERGRTSGERALAPTA